ncbi:MAG: hypothetical protein SCM88_13100 [Bacillota bacterium]|nr:hypothetical protein [Bacillota bacterium]
MVEKPEQGTGNPYESCLHHNVWEPINQSIDTTMDGITLEDLMEAFKQQEQGATLMFYI